MFAFPYRPFHPLNALVVFILLSAGTLAQQDNLSAYSAVLKDFKCPWCKQTVESPVQTMWPFPTYKPNAWDKYYVGELSEGRTSISSGVAAGVTIGIFFTVFLLTFGCRIYSARRERLERRNSSPSETSAEMFAADLWICGVPRDPPPPYEVAIQMPSRASLPPPPAINNEPPPNPPSPPDT